MAIIAMGIETSPILSKGHDLRMNVSKNFTLRELVHSNHAIRAGISAEQAEVPRSAIVAMTALVHKVIQPARDHFGPIIINSAWRCKELNELLHSSPNSDHCCGWGDGENGEGLFSDRHCYTCAIYGILMASTGIFKKVLHQVNPCSTSGSIQKET